MKALGSFRFIRRWRGDVVGVAHERALGVVMKCFGLVVVTRNSIHGDFVLHFVDVALPFGGFVLHHGVVDVALSKNVKAIKKVSAEGAAVLFVGEATEHLF